MLNMQDIGYFVYMQEQEEKEQEERALKVNVKNNTDFVGEQAPTKEERDRNKFFSWNIPPISICLYNTPAAF